ncbi:MAG: hypothetical protein ACOX8Q_06855 [Christensenellales bacterium]
MQKPSTLLLIEPECGIYRCGTLCRGYPKPKDKLVLADQKNSRIFGLYHPAKTAH